MCPLSPLAAFASEDPGEITGCATLLPVGTYVSYTFKQKMYLSSIFYKMGTWAERKQWLNF